MALLLMRVTVRCGTCWGSLDLELRPSPHHQQTVARDGSRTVVLVTARDDDAWLQLFRDAHRGPLRVHLP